MKYKNNKPLDTLTLGPSIRDIETLIKNGNNDNANLNWGPESNHKWISDITMKQYALIKMFSGEISEAHLNGYLHLHDLEYAFDRPINCFQHDIRFLLQHGLKVDGTGFSTSASGPARNIETLINHIGQAMMAGQTNLSGGQGTSFFNVFVAPFARGISYERIKQAMQMFIFNLNMSYVSRGSQPIFSTIGLEFDIPEWLQDEPAYGIGGEVVGVYGDYHDEAQLILKAFTEVMMEGDVSNKPHLFPNTVYYLRDSSFKYPELVGLVHELSAKFSTPYFAKEIGSPATIMGCRTRLNTNWTGNPNDDILRTGNLAYVSLNLPRYALKGNFWEELDKALDIAKDALLIRREHAIKLLNNGYMKFLTQGDGGDEYYRVDNSTISFGIVGLSDTLTILTGEGILNAKSRKMGHQIMRYINDYAKQLQQETGFRWTVLQSPAESTAGKFATEDKRRYPTRAPVHGVRGAYYYTNSTHVDVDSPVTIVDRINAEHNFHRETGGGHIFHGFFGENTLDVEAAMKMTKNIYDHSNLGFWTYTAAYSICNDDGQLIRGIQPKCDCGAGTEIYSRITGYMQRTSGWNPGKKAEFQDRKRY
jgi:anaerobic ribonucleoside-triphosphate reductase